MAWEWFSFQFHPYSVSTWGSSKTDKEEKAIPVSRLLRRMRNVLEIEIGDVWVEGEVSNLRKQSSGHYYFSLKDDGGQVACAMFGARRKRGAEVLEDGAHIRLLGEVTLYEARGTAQVVVREVEPVGAGQLQARFEALKKALHEEGLFDAARKRALPPFPQRIGVVTSGTGAALQDMLTVLGRRAPWVTVVLFDVQVQGRGAERGIADAIHYASRCDVEDADYCDVLIVGRGGGSLEDLWNFNEEVVARAISDCAKPVVSAVGHEIDFTIADFVADLRAPTPSAAAELVVPDGAELHQRLQQLRQRIERRAGERIERAGEQLEFYQRGVLARDSDVFLRPQEMRLDDVLGRLEQAVERDLREGLSGLRELAARWKAREPRRVLEQQEARQQMLSQRLGSLLVNSLEQREAELKRVADLLSALGPESAFERGFSITMNSAGEIVRHAEQIGSGERLETLMKGGVVASRVE